MRIQEDIKKKIIEAMRSKEALRLEVLRGLSAAFTNELVAQKQKPDAEVSDELALSVITREAKKRREAIESFEKGGRQELADKEKKELEILETFLPEMMSVEEVQKIVETKKKELGIDDPSKKGELIGALMKELKGKADGKTVKDIVDSLF